MMKKKMNLFFFVMAMAMNWYVIKAALPHFLISRAVIFVVRSFSAGLKASKPSFAVDTAVLDPRMLVYLFDIGLTQHNAMN